MNKYNHKKIDWSKCPSIEKNADIENTNKHIMDIELPEEKDRIIMDDKEFPEFGRRIKDSLDMLLEPYGNKYQLIDYDFLHGDYVNYGIWFTVKANFDTKMSNFNIHETTFDISKRTIKISGNCFHNNLDDDANEGLSRILNNAK